MSLNKSNSYHVKNLFLKSWKSLESLYGHVICILSHLKREGKISYQFKKRTPEWALWNVSPENSTDTLCPYSLKRNTCICFCNTSRLVKKSLKCSYFHRRWGTLVFPGKYWEIKYRIHDLLFLITFTVNYHVDNKELLVSSMCMVFRQCLKFNNSAHVNTYGIVSTYK